MYNFNCICKLVNLFLCGNSSIGRVPALQAGSCGFDSRLPLFYVVSKYIKLFIRECRFISALPLFSLSKSFDNLIYECF